MDYTHGALTEEEVSQERRMAERPKDKWRRWRKISSSTVSKAALTSYRARAKECQLTAVDSS